MLNQSFSAENFRKIIALENRKGVYLEGKFFTNLNSLTEDIKECNRKIKKKKKEKDVDSEGMKELFQDRDSLKKQKESILNGELETISKKVLATDFHIALTKKNIPGDKPLYVPKDSADHFLTMKQLQRNIARLFNVKQANRFNIISQVKMLLSDTFPKYVIRTDIKDFYESIPHAPLLEIINRNNLLTHLSRKFVRQVLNSYKELSGNDKGLPRGVGISAYLSELYMRDLDHSIMSSVNGIIYYARYVDDIIIILTPKVDEQQRDYLKEIKTIIKGKKFNLELNDVKTKLFDLWNDTKNYTVEYLGYKISFGKGGVKTELTKKKEQKYKTRIDAAFKNYMELSKVNEKKARKLLVKRIRFLTGNTRLKNNKNNVLVGIYYSNSQLTETKVLTGLDKYLQYKVNKIRSASLKARLNPYSFKLGFLEKRFSPFKIHELKQIMEVWK